MSSNVADETDNPGSQGAPFNPHPAEGPLHKPVRDPVARWIAIGGLIVAGSMFVVAYLQLHNGNIQAQSAETQARLKAAETRPEVRYYPAFFGTKGLQIHARMENLGALPAKVTYSTIRVAVDWHILPWDLHSTSADILYPSKKSESIVPTIPGPLSKSIALGREDLIVGMCAIYQASSDTAGPTWQMTGVYRFVPGKNDPENLSISDREISRMTPQCSPEADMRVQAVQRLKVL
jgi:hypothetical protein